ncbi:MAG: hypothetical protein JO148_04845 [Acidimicrobiia bacterium]|nr:hypothetical protein [Acidimicrobiia bacterium]
MSSWVVALEVGEDPDGPALDAAAMARRMEAVADIRPTAYGKGQRRHSFLLRLDGQTPTDAVVSAISRFRDAAVSGGALFGARVVRSAELGGGAAAAGAALPGSTRPPTPALRPKVLVVAAAVLLLGAGLLAIGGRSSAASKGSAAAARAPVAANLLTNPSFERDSRTKGLARGLTVWGDAHPALVDDPVHSGDQAQQLEVGPGRTGGAWFDVDAIGGRTYIQSAWIDVQQLAPGARVELLLEWYGSTANLLGYQAVPITTIDSGFVSRQQTVAAPPGTVRARFLVNFTGGGAAIVDDAALRSPSQV